MNMNPEETLRHVEQVLQQLGQSLDIDLALDQEGGCYFEHQEGWRMAILYPGGDQIVTAVSVLSGVEVAEDQLGPVLVEFNWLGARSRGAALSWNPLTRSFLLWHSRDAESTTAESLNQLLLRLVEVGMQLRPELQDRISAKTDKEEPATRPRGPGFVRA